MVQSRRVNSQHLGSWLHGMLGPSLGNADGLNFLCTLLFVIVSPPLPPPPFDSHFHLLSSNKNSV